MLKIKAAILGACMAVAAAMAANEFLTNPLLQVTDGFYSTTFGGAQQQFDLQTTNLVSSEGVINVTTNYTAIPLGEVASPGWAWFQNLAATNGVQIGVEVDSTFHALLEIPAGASFPYYFATTNLHAKWTVDSGRLLYRIFER